MESTATDTTTVYVDSVPPGSIMMWSGLQSEKPEGWFFCDGDNGTPDLRNKFIYGAETAAASNWPTGGNLNNEVTLTKNNIPELVSQNHTHPVNITSKGHTHGYTASSMNGGGTQVNGNMASSGSSIGMWLNSTGHTTGSSTVDVVGATENATVTVGNAAPTAVNITPEYVALAFIMKGKSS